MKKIVLVSLLVLIAISGGFLLFFNAGFYQIDVDYCLDRGGSYNYETCGCDFEKSHEKQNTHQCF